MTWSYEDQILNQRERENDDCAGCPFAGVNTCLNQCHEVTAIYNKNLYKGAYKNEKTVF